MDLPSSSKTPGLRLPYGSYIQTKSLFLVYTGLHIPKARYKAWLTEVLIKSRFQAHIEEMRISHKTSGLSCKITKYTYVIVRLSKPLRTPKQKLFTWEGAHPEISTLKNTHQINEAIKYLEEWTPETNPQASEASSSESEQDQEAQKEISEEASEEITLPPQLVIQVPTQVPAAVRKRASEPVQQQAPKPPLDVKRIFVPVLQYPEDHDLVANVGTRSWELQAQELMEKYRKSPPPDAYGGRKCLSVFYLYNDVGTVDMMKLLQNGNAGPIKRVLILNELPAPGKIVEVITRANRGWTGEILVLDLTHQEDVGYLWSELDRSIDRYIAETIWLFTKRMPYLVRGGTGQFYWKQHHVVHLRDGSPRLRLMPLDLAKEIWETEFTVMHSS